MLGPQADSFTPRSAPPGAEILIQGSGFAPQTIDDVHDRNTVFLETSEGTQFPVRPLMAEPEVMRVALPPLPKPDGQWYAGEVRLCVEVDEQIACAAEKLIIERAIESNAALGEILLESAQESLDTTIAALEALGATDLARETQERGAAQIQELREIVAQARAGRPPLVAGLEHDSSPVAIDLDTIGEIESLLLANRLSAVSLTRDLRTSRIQLKEIAKLEPDCGYSSEKVKSEKKLAYDTLVQEQKRIAIAYLAVVAATAVSGCLLSIFVGCVPGAALAVAITMPTAGTLFSIQSGKNFAEQLAIEYNEPNLLRSLSVEPQTLNLTVGGQQAFVMSGKFANITGKRKAVLVIKRLALDAIGAVVPSNAPIKLVSWLVDKLALILADQIGDFIIQSVARAPGNLEEEILLSSHTVGQTNHPPEASISAACNENDRWTAFGEQSTSGRSIGFAAKSDRLLMLNPNLGPPMASLLVRVNQIPDPVLEPRFSI